MKNEKIVEIQDHKNGSRISWPGFFGNNSGATHVFYTRGFSNTNLPKTKFAVVESDDVHYQEGLINYVGAYKSFGRELSNLLDVCNNEDEAKQICKEKVLELAKEKAKGKYRIVQKSIYELVIPWGIHLHIKEKYLALYEGKK